MGDGQILSDRVGEVGGFWAKLQGWELGEGRSYPPYTLYPLYLDRVKIYLVKVPNPAAGKTHSPLLDWETTFL